MPKIRGSHPQLPPLPPLPTHDCPAIRPSASARSPLKKSSSGTVTAAGASAVRARVAAVVSKNARSLVWPWICLRIAETPPQPL